MNSLDNLRTFPWLAEREKQGSLSLHGWWFDMDGGALWCHSPPDRTFTQLIPSASE
jgi:carbonic anhydrase